MTGCRNSCLSAPGMSGTVTEIQHFSIHDGPGIRTTVFLKGCSLRCKWCCNPEAVEPRPELSYNRKQCIGKNECGHCLPVCPEAALQVSDTDDIVRINWDLCSNCGKCTEVCPSRALSFIGRVMTVAVVMAEIEQDNAFYAESGGGLTLSGGECLLQPEFAAELLKEARKYGLQTAIETAGNVPWRFMKQVLPYVDVVLHDHKLTNPGQHKHWTGVDNRRILDNYRRAYEAFPQISFVARIPVIPGVNDTPEHVQAVLDFIRPYSNVVELELLPYHDFGDSKYAYIGQTYELENFQPPSTELMRSLRDLVAASFADHVHPAGARYSGELRP